MLHAVAQRFEREDRIIQYVKRMFCVNGWHYNTEQIGPPSVGMTIQTGAKCSCKILGYRFYEPISLSPLTVNRNKNEKKQDADNTTSKKLNSSIHNLTTIDNNHSQILKVQCMCKIDWCSNHGQLACKNSDVFQRYLWSESRPY